jgi:hypothetical protein
LRVIRNRRNGGMKTEDLHSHVATAQDY